MTKEEFSQFIIKHDFTRSTLAEFLGVTPQAVRFWELGERPVPQTTIRILRFFDKYPAMMGKF